MPTLSNDIIEAAIDGFEAQKQRIDAQIAELRGMLKGGASQTVAHTTGRWTLSPEVKQRMREAQQKRWAKARGESAPPAKAVKTAKPKRKLSAAGRKAISEATKKRWAAKRAAKAS